MILALSYLHRVIDQETGATAIAGLTLEGNNRRDWLPLAVGSNTLQYEELGATDLQITVKYRNRYFD